MKTIKRWRYYCDFCKKSGGQGAAMAKHERGCTLNPARVCRHCALTGGDSPTPLADLIAMLPDPAKCTVHSPAEDLGEFGTVPAYDMLDDEVLRAAVHLVLPKLREASGHCPSCILAALRQRGIPVPVVTEFNYSEELKSMWSEFNAERESSPYY
ncbi:MAG: hypothetical protein V4669_13965 [Pseudomonadota bacterium]